MDWMLMQESRRRLRRLPSLPTNHDERCCSFHHRVSLASASNGLEGSLSGSDGYDEEDVEENNGGRRELCLDGDGVESAEECSGLPRTSSSSWLLL